jgi:hypothetical protein
MCRQRFCIDMHTMSKLGSVRVQRLACSAHGYGMGKVNPCTMLQGLLLLGELLGGRLVTLLGAHACYLSHPN